jgi:hypothetical protein
MFLENSRYCRQPLVNGITRDGRMVKAISLRRLPPLTGDPTVVKGGDRLDILAQRQYNDPTWFWHIADANTELEANALVNPPLRVINLPRT